VKFPLLALLARGPAHGYELKQDFEKHFEGVWGELNIGQVYTTLGRLERDGLVESREVEQSDRPNKRVYELTGAGREALLTWLDEPAVRPRVRDDFVLKLVLAGLAGLADPRQLIDRQRSEYFQALRDFNAFASRRNGGSVTERLIIAGATLHLEADLKWLDAADEQLESGELP
jgi:DNA-binding PadR family transcriptional regulator